MKFINKFKSPNFNKRNSSNIIFIIIHYTALDNFTEAISYLCNKKNKVSSHFLISQKGLIYSLVKEKKRAWHAGQSYWKNYTDLNSLSIGIELDYSKNKLNNKFSKEMITSLQILLNYLTKKYKIDKKNILAHSDISPFRKIDPGPEFPWKKLYFSNLVYMPKNEKKANISLVQNWFNKYGLKSKIKKTYFILSYIGYDTFNVQNDKKLLKKLIKAYQMHYLQSNISGRVDSLTIKTLIIHFLNLVLTRK